MHHHTRELERIFPVTFTFLDSDDAVTDIPDNCPQPASLVQHLKDFPHPLFPWLGELADLERKCREVKDADNKPQCPSSLSPHPALQLVACSWQGLPQLLREATYATSVKDLLSRTAPEEGGEYVLVLPDAQSGVRCEPASDEDLLALKIVTEGLSLADVAQQARTSVTAIRALLERAVQRGLLLQPASLLLRPESTHPRIVDQKGSPMFSDRVYMAEAFTLQWHITQRCDLRCKHCYDRSDRQDTHLDSGMRLLDEMAAFCESRHVQGQVSLSGGNPLLHPDFFTLYAAAVERGLNVALLANPCPSESLDAMLALDMPVYFQISLEGLEEHNDSIRGKGHYRRAMAFLDLLQERGISAQVMLTLTRGNMQEVIPLARELQGKVERFTFNRLAPVGEGAALACADPQAYTGFLQDYIREAGSLPHVRLKDNLLNPALHQAGEPLFGGCTGHGCGAAFNFMAVLGDGEAFACRKLHSPLGNVHQQGLAAVYDGPLAAKYRQGSEACATCSLRPVCGGCLAVTAGMGFDPFTARDPYCFL